MNKIKIVVVVVVVVVVGIGSKPKLNHRGGRCISGPSRRCHSKLKLNPLTSKKLDNLCTNQIQLRLYKNLLQLIQQNYLTRIEKICNFLRYKCTIFGMVL